MGLSFLNVIWIHGPTCPPPSRRPCIRLKAKAMDTKISRPRTDPLEAKDPGASVLKAKGLQKKFFRRSQKKGLKNFFSGDLHLRKTKEGLGKFSARFLAFSNKISTMQKIVLSSSREQGNFRGLEASRPMPRTSKCVLKDVLEAMNVLKDSTSAAQKYQVTSYDKLVISFLKLCNRIN